MDVPIDRAFVRIDEGLVHYRHVEGKPGERPVLMIHLSPASSRRMEPFMSALRGLGHQGPIIAPDTLGYGDSARPGVEEPDIAYFADSTARVLDKLGIDQVDLFGIHTGARIACELAASRPDRVRRLVMDGILEYSDETRALYKANYLPRVQPDPFGTQMIWAFNYSRNQHLFAPWFLQDKEHRLRNSVPSPQALHESTLDILKSLDTYQVAYSAAFAYPANSRIAALTVPTLLLKPDYGSPHINAAADALANGANVTALDTVDGDMGITRAMMDFFAAD